MMDLAALRKRLPSLSDEQVDAAFRLVEDIRGRESLSDFILRVSPHHPPPPHIRPLIKAIERARWEPLRLCVSMPPRHAKTITILHGIAWWIQNSPEDTCAYVSYSDRQALSKSRICRALAEIAGVSASGDSAAASEWRTREGGGLIAAGALAGITGQGVHGLMVVDDPYKNREEADSPVIREKIWETFNEVVFTRLEGASVIVCHCVARGEPVLMADGTWRPVEDVKAGEQVAAFEGGKFTARTVLDSRQSGEDPILKVSTKRKALRVNGRHPFLLESGEWRRADELAPGDRVVVCDAAYGSDHVDDEFAWLFGFMMGDGWVTRWARRNRKSSGKLSHTESLCVCVLSAFERQFGRRPKLTKFGYARIDCNYLGRRLLALGLDGGAHGKRIPAWVFRLSRAGKLAYLRGHADADDTPLARTKGAFRVSSVSRDLIEDVRRLAISAGIRAGRVGSFKQHVRAPHSKEAKPYECFVVTLNFATSPDRVEVVQSVEPDGFGAVYDLTVDGAENFVAGGFVVHNTRWHQDDLTGRLAGMGWEAINLPALAEPGDVMGRAPGEALWPDNPNLDAERLRAIQKQIGPWSFAALYQGAPRPRGHSLFGPAHYHEDDRMDGHRIVIYADPAASEKTTADYGVMMAMAIKGNAEKQSAKVLEVSRGQSTVPEFARRLRAFQQRHGNAPVSVESVGGFKAVPQILREIEPGIRIREDHPKGDKFQRAQGVASAWNDGRVTVPRGAPWVPAFLAEVTAFTGVNDAYDDQVDCLSGCWNSPAGSPRYEPTSGLNPYTR